MENLEQTNEQIQELIQTAYTLSLSYGPKVVLALLTLIIGLWLINKFIRTLKANLTSKVDATLGSFVGSIFSVILKMVLLISVASMVGIETTSFIAVLGAAGLAVGLALKDSLSNFASGVMIILFKPYKIGDVVTAAGTTGKIKEIHLFNTEFTTPDNQKILVPNSAITSGSITNINAHDTRRVDLVIGIGFLTPQ